MRINNANPRCCYTWFKCMFLLYKWDGSADNSCFVYSPYVQRRCRFPFVQVSTRYPGVYTLFQSPFPSHFWETLLLALMKKHPHCHILWTLGLLLYRMILLPKHNLYTMTSSNGNNLQVTGPLCGEFTGHQWIPAQRPETRGFDVLFDLRPNKWLSKQSWGWWFETPSYPLWRHCNDTQSSPSFVFLWY